MSRLADFYSRCVRYFRSRLGQILVGIVMENVVFRREIGMDPFGRLRPGSPLFWAHGLMVGCLAVDALLFLMGGWWPMMGGAAVLMGVFVLGTQPYAAARAFGSLARDRSGGALQDLLLTSLEPEEVLEGKFFGLLAPLVEVRRYVLLLGAFVCLGYWRLHPGPWFLLVLAIWLTGVNQIGHSLYFGTLAGIKWGLLGEPRAGQIVRDWRLNPWPFHLWLHVKAGVLLGLPLAFLFWLGARNPWTLYSGFGLLLVVPFYAGVHLHERQQAEYERLKSSARLLMSLEGGGNPSATSDPGRSE